MLGGEAFSSAAFDALTGDISGSLSPDVASTSTEFFVYGTGTLSLSATFAIYVATQEFATLPTDNLPSQSFFGVLEQPFTFRRTIIGDTIGVYTVADGELEINNTDATYDYLTQSYSIDGRQIIVKAGLKGGSYNNYFTVFNGTASDWNIDETGVHITLRDFSYKLAVPAQPNIYGGTGGSDGGADLQGKRKPRSFGYVLNISPPLVDSSNLVYQINDGRMRAVDAIYDRGVALTPITTLDSVRFNGTTRYLTRDAALTGAVDSPKWTFSVWVRKQDAVLGQRIFAAVDTLGSGNGVTRVAFAASTGEFFTQAYNAASTIILDLRVPGSVAPTVGLWYHYLFSVDLSTPGAVKLYVNDVEQVGALLTFTTDTIKFTWPDWGLGGYPNGASLLNADVAFLWSQPGLYYDLTVTSNRRKFITPEGSPANLGINGELVTGSTPLAYFSGSSSSFATNKGSGGGFTTHGTLADSTITVTTDYLTYADLVAAQLKAGNYATCLAEGFFRLYSNPSGTITADLEGEQANLGSGNYVFYSSTGTIIRRLLASTALVDPDDLYTPSFDAMEFYQPAPIGYWLGPDDTQTVADVIANLMGGVGGWGGFRREGLFELDIFRAAQLTDAELEELETEMARTRLLVQFTGIAGTQTFTDSSIYNNTLTVNSDGLGNPSIDGTRTKFGTTGLFKNYHQSPDLNSFLSFTRNPTIVNSAGDWTFDCWFRPLETMAADGFGAWPVILGGSSGNLFYLQIGGSLGDTNIYIWMNSTDTASPPGDIVNFASIGHYTIGQWSHIAVVRSGNMYYGFVDGILGWSLSSALSVPNVAGPLYIGFTEGNLDDFRWTTDEARWTANFAPPAAQAIIAPASSVGVPSALYDRTNIINITRERLPNSLTPPPWRQRVGYQRAWTTQTDLAGSVSVSRKTFLAEQVRVAEASDVTIKTDHPFAKDSAPVQSFFANESDAQDEADRRLSLYGTSNIALYRVQLDQRVLRRNLGEVVKVTYPRWDLSAGKLMTIVEMNEDVANKKFEIVAYG